MPETPQLPGNLHVDFGKPAPGSSNPMPAEVALAYEDRILCSAQAQVDGGRRARELFVGLTISRIALQLPPSPSGVDETGDDE